MALAREQKLTDLGGVVAAAAHELGTPLATIKLVSTELAEELEGQPQLAEDAQLISSQADRCRDILRSMGRAGKDDLHMRSAPLGAVVREAAEPHANRGVEIEMDFAAGPGAPEGSRSSGASPRSSMACETSSRTRSISRRICVWIDGTWGDGVIRLVITDDGPGFPPDMLGRLGDPFLRRRSRAPDLSRPGLRRHGAWPFHRQDPA
jgi:two-component system sensor histidine kinase RegB